MGQPPPAKPSPTLRRSALALAASSVWAGDILACVDGAPSFIGVFLCSAFANIQVQEPVFKYLGHHMAHPTYHAGVHNDVLSRAQADIARFGHLPLNAHERVQLQFSYHNGYITAYWCPTTAFSTGWIGFPGVSLRQPKAWKRCKESRTSFPQRVQGGWGPTRSFGVFGHNTSQ